MNKLYPLAYWHFNNNMINNTLEDSWKKKSRPNYIKLGLK